MKKNIITILLLAVSTLSFAQIKKNSTLLGGYLAYYNGKYQYDNYNINRQKIESGSFGISIGKAFKENSILGINLSYSPYKQTNYVIANDTASIDRKLYIIGAYFREYKKLRKDFYFFGQLNAGFIMANQKNDYNYVNGEHTSTERGFNTSLLVGVSYKIFKKIHLELTMPDILRIEYLVSKYTYNNPQITNSKNDQFSFYSNLGNGLNLGALGVGVHFIF